MITSSPAPYVARGDRDFLRPELFNPEAELQKAGHGSVVETPDGEWYVAHLSARPLPGTLRSMLGRETSLQKVRWTADGWLELVAGGTLAGATTEGPAGVDLADGPRVPPRSPRRLRRAGARRPARRPSALPRHRTGPT